MLNWLNEEIVITIYFFARCIRPNSIRGMLLRRGYDRSLGAIERKIISTTKQYPYLKFANGQWDLSAIDRWMKDLVRSQESVNNITRFSLEDAEDMVLKISVDDLLETMDNLGLDFTDPAFNARMASQV
ncbi:uncharacterized protein N7446_005210 [Penicillium canescens]|uniref:Uncharacterized protein n=1 Tax=Penicillium canescens TaxID=5083 RepID=A0AAD6IAF4_PENCN|nr:uncharacterized protein N7446_005210 [Penicillium canescens]KAJ6038410.1 hypothetical protein N7460_008181 [Penicillium canescens]KAJ6068173.1 hypothetical protein N7446_005210 [Penicillium canescens]